MFALGDVFSYVNNRAFEQVGEFVKKDYSHVKPGPSSKDDVTNKDIAQVFDPNKILGGLESIELLAESLAELYCLKHGSETLKWIVVSAIQFLKYDTSDINRNLYSLF